MLNNLRVDPDKKCLINLPEGWITLFLAKTTQNNTPCFCSVFCPEGGYPPRGTRSAEIFDAKAAIFDSTGALVSLHDALYAQRNPWGGGLIDIYPDRKRGATWTTPDECGHNEFLGARIKPEDVLVVL